MSPRTFLFIVIGLCGSPAVSHVAHSEAPAPGDVASPAEAIPDAVKLLEELRTIKKGAEAAREAEAEKNIRVLREAARDDASALNAYKQAVRGVEFAGVVRETRQWQDWEEQNEPRLRDRDFRASLRAVLEYLALSVDAQASSIEDVAPRLQRFAEMVFEHPEWTEPFQVEDEQGRRRGQPRQSPLMESSNQSVFVKWLRLEPLLKTGKDWEDVPGNAEGIYEKSILPLWRETKNPALIDYWTARMEREAAVAKESGRDQARLRFEQETLPQLRWARAKDLAVLGRTSEAVNEMIGILRTHQAHPQFDRWAEELTALLGGG